MPAVIPIAAAVVGGAIASNGAKKAANAQAAATDRASDSALQGQREGIAAQERAQAQARADNEPWRLAGVSALNKLTGMSDFTGATLQSEPGYAFGLSEGMKGLTNSAAARGGLLSGAALKAASKFNQDYAGTKYNEAFNRDATNKNRLASLAGVGQTSASQNASGALAMGNNIGNMYMNTANTIGNNMIGAGNARASSYLAQSNALTGALNQGVSMWNQSRTAAPAAQSGGDWYNQSGNF